MTITIEVPESYRPLVDIELLQQAIGCVLAAERAEGDLTVKITDDDEVAALNQQFLGKEGPTDVLSFPAGPDDDAFVLPPDEARTPYLGDILIALPYTQRQAPRAGRSLRDELTLLAVHGALHLLGYDHATPEEKREMWARQNAILSGLGIPPLEE